LGLLLGRRPASSAFGFGLQGLGELFNFFGFLDRALRSLLDFFAEFACELLKPRDPFAEFLLNFVAAWLVLRQRQLSGSLVTLRGSEFQRAVDAEAE